MSRSKGKFFVFKFATDRFICRNLLSLASDKKQTKIVVIARLAIPHSCVQFHTIPHSCAQFHAIPRNGIRIETPNCIPISTVYITHNYIIIYILKQDIICIYVAYSRPNGWAEWAEIFLWKLTGVGCLRL